MTWPFLYRSGEVLSGPELRAARLDGDVVEIGEAFMPADAVETRELRAGSLRDLVGTNLALTHESAAWVHGAIPEPPARHSVQRCVAARPHHILDRRLQYRDLRLPPRDVVLIAGVAVTTPVRTLVDLVRHRHEGLDGELAPAEAMLAADPTLVEAALAWCATAGPVHHKKTAVGYLRARALTTR